MFEWYEIILKLTNYDKILIKNWLIVWFKITLFLYQVTSQAGNNAGSVSSAGVQITHPNHSPHSRNQMNDHHVPLKTPIGLYNFSSKFFYEVMTITNGLVHYLPNFLISDYSAYTCASCFKR